VIEFIVLLAIAPLVLAGQLLSDLWRLRQRLKQTPLHERNRTRAMFGAAALVGCAVLAVKGFPVVGAKATGIIAAIALLYLVVGVKGSHTASYDVISACWYAAAAVGSVVLLVFIRRHGWPL
jgi:hypothetical protein